jgi:uncharacterized membrane protein HdeD (DUF308 family)
VVFGGALLAVPGAGLVVIIWWIGAYALVSGIVMITLAFKLRARRQPVPV